jgi:hypothetical protein
VNAPLLDEKILALHAALTAAAIPHAFGGALALAYYATPRATQDIDCNVFVAVDASERVMEAITPLGVTRPNADEARALRERGQMRVFWEHTPIDLFFAYDPLHESCMERTRRVPFGDRVTLPILSAEDLAVFKTLFDREKDRRDLREMLFALGADFDAAYALAWTRRILAADDERRRRFEDLLAASPG